MSDRAESSTQVPRDRIRETRWGIVAEIDGSDVPLFGELPDGDDPVEVEVRKAP